MNHYDQLPSVQNHFGQFQVSMHNWFIDFNGGKTQLISFDLSNNSDATDTKMNGFVIEEKLFFKMLGLSF